MLCVQVLSVTRSGPDLAGGRLGPSWTYCPVEGPRPGGQINSVSVKGLLNYTMVKHRAEEKMDLTETMTNTVRQLSRSLVGIYH